MNIKIGELLFEENNSDSIHEVFEKNENSSLTIDNKDLIAEEKKRQFKKNRAFFGQEEQNLNKQQLGRLSSIISRQVKDKFDSPEVIKDQILSQKINNGVPTEQIVNALKLQKFTLSGNVNINIFNIFDTKPTKDGELPLATRKDLDRYAKWGIICCELVSKGKVVSGENSQGKNIREFFIMPFPGFATDDKNLIKLHTKLFDLDFSKVEKSKVKNPKIAHLGLGKIFHDFPVVETPPKEGENNTVSVEVQKLQDSLRQGLLAKILEYEKKANLGSARSTVSDIGKSTKETDETSSDTKPTDTSSASDTNENFIHKNSLSNLLFEKKSLNKLSSKQKKALVENYFNVDYAKLNNYKKRDYYFLTKILIKEELNDNQSLIVESSFLNEDRWDNSISWLKKKISTSVDALKTAKDDGVKATLKKVIDKAKEKLDQKEKEVDAEYFENIGDDESSTVFMSTPTFNQPEDADSGKDLEDDYEEPEKEDLDSDIVASVGDNSYLKIILKEYSDTINDPTVRKMFVSRNFLQKEINKAIGEAQAYIDNLPDYSSILSDMQSKQGYGNEVGDGGLNKDQQEDAIKKYITHLEDGDNKFKDQVEKLIEGLIELIKYNPVTDTSRQSEITKNCKDIKGFNPTGKVAKDFKKFSKVSEISNVFDILNRDIAIMMLIENHVYQCITTLGILEKTLGMHLAAQQVDANFDVLDLMDDEGNVTNEDNLSLRVYSISKEFGLSFDEVKSMLSPGIDESIKIKNKNLLNEDAVQKKQIIKLRKRIIVDTNGNVDPSALKGLYNELDNDTAYEKLRANFIEKFKKRMGKTINNASDDEISTELSIYFDEMLSSGIGTFKGDPAATASPVSSGSSTPKKAWYVRTFNWLKNKGKWGLILAGVAVTAYGVYDWFFNEKKTLKKILGNILLKYGSKVATAIGGSAGTGLVTAMIGWIWGSSTSGTPPIPSSIFSGIGSTLPSIPIFGTVWGIATKGWGWAWSGIKKFFTDPTAWFSTTLLPWLSAPYVAYTSGIAGTVAVTAGSFAAFITAFPIIGTFFTGIAVGGMKAAAAASPFLKTWATSLGMTKTATFFGKGTGLATKATTLWKGALAGGAAAGWFGVGTALVLAGLVIWAIKSWKESKKKGIDKKIAEMLKIYVLAAALNMKIEEVMTLLGLDPSAYLSELTKNILPSDAELKTFWEKFENEDLNTYLAMFTSKLKKLLNKGSFGYFYSSAKFTKPMSGIADGVTNKEEFEGFIKLFKEYINILSNENAVKSSTLKILEEVTDAFEMDLKLLREGYDENQFFTYYASPKIKGIIASYLNGNRNHQAISDVDKFSLIDSKEELLASIQNARNKELASLNKFGSIKLADDPINMLASQIQSAGLKEKIDYKINIAKIFEKLHDNIDDSSIDVDSIVASIKDRHGHIAANDIRQFQSKGYLEKIPGASGGKESPEKYVKLYFKSIYGNLANSIESIVDTAVLEESRSKRLNILNEIRRANNLNLYRIGNNKELLNEVSILGAVKGLGLGGGILGGAALLTLKTVTVTALAPWLAISLANLSTIGLTLFTYYLGIKSVEAIIETFRDFKYEANTNPYDDKRYVEAVSGMIKTIAKLRIGVSYAKVILQHKKALEKIGVTILGEDSPMFAETNKKVKDAIQKQELKRNLNESGIAIYNIFIDAAYKIRNKNAEGIGKYINEAFLDNYVDNLCFSSSSALSPMFKHLQEESKPDVTTETFVYKKGLGLLLEEDSKSKKSAITLPLNKVYSNIKSETEKLLYSTIDLNGSVNSAILEELAPHFEQGLWKKLFQKRLWARTKFANDKVSDAISKITNMPKEQALQVLNSKKSKTKESQTKEAQQNLELSHNDRMIHKLGLSVLLEAKYDTYEQLFKQGNDYFVKFGSNHSQHTASSGPYIFKVASGDIDASGNITKVLKSNLYHGNQATDIISKSTDITSQVSTDPVLQTMLKSAGENTTSGVSGISFDPSTIPTTSATVTPTTAAVTPITPAVKSVVWTAADEDAFNTAQEILENTIHDLLEWKNIFIGAKLFQGLLATPINARTYVPLISGIDWSKIIMLTYASVMTKILEVYRDPLRQSGIHITGSLPEEVNSTLSGAKSDLTGTYNKEPLGALSSEIVRRMKERPGFRIRKDTEKDIIKFMKDDIVNMIYTYHKSYRTETYEKIASATSKQMTATGYDKASKEKDVRTGLGLGLMGGAAYAALASTGPVGWLAIAGITVSGALGANQYSRRLEGFDRNQILSGEESIEAEQSVIKKMLEADAERLIKVMLSISKDVKGIKSESYDLIHKNSLLSLLIEASDATSHSVPVENIIKSLKSNQVLVYDGSIKRGTEEFRDAEAYTIDMVCAQLESMCNIEVTGAEKYSNPVVTSRNVVETMTSNPEPQSVQQMEPYSHSIAAVTAAGQVPQMDKTINPQQFMSTLNQTGGNSMMTVMPQIVQSVMGQNSGQMPKGFDWNKFFKALEDGEFTTREAGQQVASAINSAPKGQKSISGNDFIEAFETVVKTNVANLPKVNKSHMIKVFNNLQGLPTIINLLNKESTTKDLLTITPEGEKLFASTGASSKKVRMKDFVNQYVDGWFNILDGDKELEKYNANKIKDIQVELDKSLMGVKAILKVDSATGANNVSEVNNFILDVMIPNYFTKIVNSSLGVTIEIDNIDKTLASASISDSDDQDFVVAVNKTFESVSVNESRVSRKKVIASRREDKLLSEEYLMGDLSSLLFNESVEIERSKRTRKKISKSNINLSKEWLKIWDI